MNYWDRLKRLLFRNKYRLKHAEARIGRLEKQIQSLQAQLRDVTSTLPGFADVFRSMIAPLVPHAAAGVAKRRVGVADDGAYVMLDDFNGIAAAYSLGIGKEVSWDLDVAAQNIVVHQFDPSVKAPPSGHPLFRFQPKRVVAGRGSSEPGTITLREMLAGTVGEGGALLKMDIEGAEWDVLDSVPEDVLRHFRQIAVEFHGFNRYCDQQWRDRATRIFQKLTAFHRLVHVHGNNFNPTFGAGVREFPYDVEMTFALASAYRLSPSFESFPCSLDRPNKPNMPDYDLGDFRF
jgi:hypothetical protein